MDVLGSAEGLWPENDDILFEIFSYFQRFRELAVLTRVCKRFRRLLLSDRSEGLWKPLYEKLVETDILHVKDRKIVRRHRRFQGDPKNWKCGAQNPSCNHLKNPSHWVKTYVRGIPPNLRIKRRFFACGMLYIVNDGGHVFSETVKFLGNY